MVDSPPYGPSILPMPEFGPFEKIVDIRIGDEFAGSRNFIVNGAAGLPSPPGTFRVIVKPKKPPPKPPPGPPGPSGATGPHPPPPPPPTCWVTNYVYCNVAGGCACGPEFKSCERQLLSIGAEPIGAIVADASYCEFGQVVAFLIGNIWTWSCPGPPTGSPPIVTPLPSSHPAYIQYYLDHGWSQGGMPDCGGG